MAKKIGRQTIQMENKPFILGYGSVAGQKESKGPIGACFDKIFEDSLMNEKTWERAEALFQKEAAVIAMNRANITPKDLDFVFAGDLLDQCISSILGFKYMQVPFLGQFGACSTMAQCMILASIMVDSGVAKNCLATTSSHFCSAERQYRFPLEYGGQRTPTAQWTVTGAGAVIIGDSNTDPDAICIEKALVGEIIDFEITDASNMGAAMAPAAAKSIESFLNETNSVPEDYDLILTGDLGKLGSEMLKKILLKSDINITQNHNDCGLMIYNLKEQDVHCGGSGCGCSASTLCSVILQKMKLKRFNNILFLATGALMSPTSFKQGESIPGIAHLLQIKNTKNTANSNKVASSI
ncbi:MAG: stage V sporulation protein AD [Candidatus Improbicoccus devescovinae]|nr:MAG: stage V sporulation protein AD [Candidatus Improbicoccus devescovinae]